MVIDIVADLVALTSKDDQGLAGDMGIHLADGANDTVAEDLDHKLGKGRCMEPGYHSRDRLSAYNCAAVVDEGDVKARPRVKT